MKYPALDLSTINKSFNLPEDQYYKQLTEKKQICLHHTASGPGTGGDVKWWKDDPRRVATCVIIGRNGEIDQCFISQYWAHHLGKGTTEALNKMCIGIEIDAWGPLVFHDGAYRSYLGTIVPKEDVVNVPMGFRTFPGSEMDPNYFYKNGYASKKAVFYHKYTKEQILAVAQLLEFWGIAYKIPLTYHEDMWDVSQRALKGEPGVWTHVSYRPDKLDCFPQEELVTMLKSLTE